MLLQYSRRGGIQPKSSRRQQTSAQHSLHAVSSSRRSLVVTCAAQNESGDAFADIKRIAKKIQGALPIVGLVSRLSAPSGGFDEVVSMAQEIKLMQAYWYNKRASLQ